MLAWPYITQKNTDLIQSKQRPQPTDVSLISKWNQEKKVLFGLGLPTMISLNYESNLNGDLLRGLTAHDESNSIQEKMTLYYARPSWNLSWSDENMATTFCANIAPPSLQSQGDREDAGMGRSLKKTQKKQHVRTKEAGRGGRMPPVRPVCQKPTAKSSFTACSTIAAVNPCHMGHERFQFVTLASQNM